MRTSKLYTRQIDNIKFSLSISLCTHSLLPFALLLCVFCVYRFFFFSSPFCAYDFFFLFSRNWPHNYCIQTCNDDIYFQFDFPLCILVFISLFYSLLPLLLLVCCHCCRCRCFVLFIVSNCIKRGRKMRVHLFVQCVTLIEQTAHDYDYDEKFYNITSLFVCVYDDGLFLIIKAN